MHPAFRVLGLGSLALLAVASLLACARPAREARDLVNPWSCSKVDPTVVSQVERQPHAETVPVVVEVSEFSLPHDEMHLAGCVSEPDVSDAVSVGTAMPWDEHPWTERQSPSSLICVGYATRDRIAGWCEQSRVRRVQPWN
jgi:hypothetical protein